MIGRAAARASQIVVTVLVMNAGCERGPNERPSSEQHPEWHVAATPAAVIGAWKGAPEYLFDRIRWVGIVGDDRVAIADGGSLSIRIFDTAGQHVRTFGREGSGPGEFRAPLGVWFSPPDTIHVFDAGLRRVSSFMVNGSLVGTRALAATGPLAYFATALSNGGLVLFWSETVRTGGEQRFTTGNPAIVPDAVHYEYIDPRGEHVGRLALEPGRWRYAPAGGVRPQSQGPVPALPAGAPVISHPFSPRPIHLARGDTIFLTDGMRPAVVARTSEGEIVRTIPLPPRALGSIETATVRLRRALEERADELNLGRLPSIPRVDSLPRIAAMLMDDQGFFWAKQYDPGTDASPLLPRRLYLAPHGGDWWVLDDRGNVEATVQLPAGFILKAVRGSLLAGITVDSMDVERVVLYRLLDRS